MADEQAFDPEAAQDRPDQDRLGQIDEEIEQARKGLDDLEGKNTGPRFMDEENQVGRAPTDIEDDGEDNAIAPG